MTFWDYGMLTESASNEKANLILLIKIPESFVIPWLFVTNLLSSVVLL